MTEEFYSRFIRPRIVASHPSPEKSEGWGTHFIGESRVGHPPDSVAFNVQPRPTGQMLIGSSRQFGVESTSVDHAILERMLRRACAYMPGLAARPALRVWTGFRAATPDKLPLIGPSATDDTVWLATGHEGLGITTALGTAALLAALMTGAEPPMAPAPYLPARFGAAGGA